MLIPPYHLSISYTMQHRVWCAIAGQDRLLHVDTTNCEIIYDLKKAAVDLSRIKIPYSRVDIWKVIWQEAALSTWCSLPSRWKSHTNCQLLVHPLWKTSQSTMTTFAWSLTFCTHKRNWRQYLTGPTQLILSWRSTAGEKTSAQYPCRYVSTILSLY